MFNDIIHREIHLRMSLKHWFIPVLLICCIHSWSSNAATDASVSYDSYISTPDFGLTSGQRGQGDDPDGDRNSNLIESWMGTHPGQVSQGIRTGTTNGMFSITHPMNPNLPLDLRGYYEWSMDLVNWYSSGAGPEGGPIVTISPVTVNNETTVTFTADSSVEQFFSRLKVETRSLPLLDLEAYWSFDEINGSVLNDDTGFGYTSQINGATSVTGVAGQALSFDGVTDDIDLSPDPFLELTEWVSIGFWSFGGSDLPKNSAIFQVFGNSTRIMSLFLPFGNEEVIWEAGGDQLKQLAPSSLYRDVWTHWVFTKNARTGEMKIYANGLLWHASFDNKGRLDTVVPDSAVIGNNIFKNIPYSGILDEFMVVGRELTDSEIYNMATSQSLPTPDYTGALGRIPMDTDMADQYNNMTLTLAGGATLAVGAGQSGGAARLGGGSAVVEISDHPDFNSTNGPWSEKTFSLWFFLNESDSRQMIFESGGSDRGFNIYVDDGTLYAGGWDVQVDQEANDIDSWPGTWRTTNINANQWHHVAIVLDASADPTRLHAGAYKAYLNGLEFDINNNSGMQIYNHADDAGIGGIRGGSRYSSGDAPGNLSGYVDDFSVWNRALTAQEIQVLALSQESQPPASPANLVVSLESENIVLDWDENPKINVTEYLVYRRRASESFYTCIASTPQSSYEDAAPPGEYFYYMVRARDNNGLLSADSNVVFADLPAPPTGLTAVDGPAGITLDWNDSSGGSAVFYNVYRSDNGGAVYNLLATNVLSSNSVDTSPQSDKSYTYMVTAVNGQGVESGFTDEVTVTVPDLLGHYTFDDVSGALVPDNSGNGNDATLNGASIVTSNIGLGSSFDGVNDFVDLPPAMFDHLVNEITISFWSNGGSDMPRNSTAFQVIGSDDSQIVNIHLPWGSGTVFWDAGGDRISYAAGAELYKENWTHWTFTKDAVSGEMKIYANGELMATTLGNTGGLDSSSPQSARLGANVIGNLFHSGVIDEFRCYNRVLSDAEIELLARDPNPDAGIGTVDFYVAPTGNDSNAGSFSEPFSTLGKARDAVRQLKDAGQNRDFRVLLRGGLYSLTSAEVFGINDSAPTGQTITYEAYPGENPVFSSGVPITGWRPVFTNPAGLPAAAQGNVWVAPTPEGLTDIFSLFDGDASLPRARTNGFIPTVQLDTSYLSDDQSILNFPQGAVEAGANMDDWELRIIPSAPWALNILPVASINEDANILRTTFEGFYDLSEPRVGTFTESAWIENSLAGLDSPGEWVIDRSAGLIYYWPLSGNPGTSVVAPALTELVRVEGSIDYDGPTDQPVTGLVFKGLTFTQAERYTWTAHRTGWELQHGWEQFDAASAMLRFRGAEDCVVEACQFVNSSATALRFDLHAMNNQVQNNVFDGIGGAGILFAGYGPGTKDVNRLNSVTRNHIRNVGEVYWHSPGIMVWQSGENIVQNNLIEDAPYTGIMVSGRISWNPTGAGEASRTIRWNEVESQIGVLGVDYPNNPEWSVREPFLHGRDNLVSRNEIRNVMEILADGNGIYISGAGKDNVIRENLIHNCTSVNFSQGIRCDNDQNETLIDRNIIHSIGGRAEFVLIKGRNDITNNIFARPLVAPDRGMLVLRADRAAGDTDNSIIQRNIFLTFRGGDTVVGQNSSQGLIRNCSADANVYHNTDASDPNWGSNYLSSEQGFGIELNSIAADPLFNSPVNGDFSFNSGSPAIVAPINFIPIDQSLMGLDGT